MRAIWWAALMAGISYFVASRLGLEGPVIVAWKGAGVGLLAVWAATRASNFDGWVIALVLALGALGDVLLETSGFTVGGIVFLAGHIVATVLYLGNRRSQPTASQSLLGVALLVGTPLVTLLITGEWTITLYGLGLGAMAAAAWTSRFPRYRLGVGAVMFVASDFLIFARMSPMEASALPGLFVWPLYFAGQALIAHGVVETLAVRRYVGIQPMRG